jgi:hypothetical protein
MNIKGKESFIPHAMGTYGDVEAKLHEVLISGLRSERAERFTTDTQSRAHTVENRTLSFAYRISNPTLQHVVHHYQY